MSRPSALLLAFAMILPVPLAAQEDAATLTITGAARVAVVPDAVRVSAQVYERAESAEAVRAALAKRVEALMAAGRPFGEAAASRLHVNRDSGGKSLLRSGEPVFAGWRSVTVALSDMEALGRALDALAGAGAEGFDVVHDIADRAPVLAEAREAAVADALTRARTYAAAAGLTLGPILDLTEAAGGAGETVRGARIVTYPISSTKGKGVAARRDAMAVSASVRIRWRVE